MTPHCRALLIGFSAALVLLPVPACSHEGVEATPGASEPGRTPVHRQQSFGGSGTVYRVVRHEVIDSRTKYQLERHIVVGGAMLEHSLRGLLEAQHDSLSQGPTGQFHQRPTHVAVFLYTGEAQARTGQGEWIARFVRVSGREQSPEIEIRQKSSSVPPTPTVSIAGRTEAELREIFWAIVRAEDRAREEAIRRIPDPPASANRATFHRILERRGSLQEELEAAGKAAVRARYRISTVQLDSIGLEALERSWPLPPL